jgi:hypothetical protein
LQRRLPNDAANAAIAICNKANLCATVRFLNRNVSVIWANNDAILHGPTALPYHRPEGEVFASITAYRMPRSANITQKKSKYPSALKHSGNARLFGIKSGH